MGTDINSSHSPKIWASTPTNSFPNISATNESFGSLVDDGVAVVVNCGLGMERSQRDWEREVVSTPYTLKSPPLLKSFTASATEATCK
eukprot:CAMPEP_0171308382 /NCGR_PEP_ID=MMETSP0816-20121228/18547_1 /TAXON_ID=420281 /ORGANISM="Proboscia inermis, Strain CCAP1064/1" /LENGTH=87 /DNA_ID=CAMNT_0011791273 /DNA_START=615 /DNA_END=878 /DNA_ORIENTATION=-